MFVSDELDLPKHLISKVFILPAKSVERVRSMFDKRTERRTGQRRASSLLWNWDWCQWLGQDYSQQSICFGVIVSLARTSRLPLVAKDSRCVYFMRINKQEEKTQTTAINTYSRDPWTHVHHSWQGQCAPLETWSPRTHLPEAHSLGGHIARSRDAQEEGGLSRVVALQNPGE